MYALQKETRYQRPRCRDDDRKPTFSLIQPIPQSPQNEWPQGLPRCGTELWRIPTLSVWSSTSVGKHELRKYAQEIKTTVRDIDGPSALSPQPKNTKRYIRKIRTDIGQVILSSNPCNNDRILPCDPCESGISFSLPLLRFMGNEDCRLEECASDVRARLRYRCSGWFSCSWVLVAVWVASSRSRSSGRSSGTEESFLGEEADAVRL